MQLPKRNELPVNLLAACFNHTTATYKFYWLLSIVQSVESGQTTIEKRELFSLMLSNAWFTVNYFHISYGKQDKIQRTVETIKDLEGLPVDDSRERVNQTLLNTTKRDTIRHLTYFDNQVPHWFLRPWFPEKSRSEIYTASQSFQNNCLYALYKDSIVVNPQWATYLVENAGVLKDFCYWNLAIFLQAKNPNVPDIPNKLIKPAVRNSLTEQRKKFWNLVFDEQGTVTCIYTGATLTINNYAVEHFVPYNFVSHDLIWNLIPADKIFNSSKSDKLPPLDKYFSQFFELQRTAVDIVRRRSPTNKLLDDYLTIFPDLDNITSERFRERIQPLITIAANNGFEFLS